MKTQPRDLEPLLSSDALRARPGASEVIGRLEPMSVALVIAALYFGRDVIVPVVLAGLLAFVLDPLVTRLSRVGLPRTIAVLVTSLLALSLIASLGLFVSAQARQLATELPTYQANVTKKLREIRATMARPGALEQVTQMLERELRLPSTTVKGREGTGSTVEPQSIPGSGATVATPPRARAAPVPPASAAPSGSPPTVAPTRVEIVQPSVSPLDAAREVIEALAGPLATSGIVLVLVILMLLDRTEIRDRLLRLLGRDLHRNTDAMGEVGRRVSRYLVMQLIVNSLYAVPLALGLWLLGIPGALLWGVLAGVLRFVPYIGPMIAGTAPLLLAVAIDPGWSTVLWALALIVTLETISNNFIEPWLYGSSTGLSALSLIVAAIFWSALWGPAIGLLVSTPLTVTILVLSKYVPQMAIFDLLLGNQPVLDTATRCYQRLVAGDHEEAAQLVSQHAQGHGAKSALATITGPALSIARSAHLGEASESHREHFVSGMGHVLAELRDQFHVSQHAPPTLLCVGPRDRLDALGADMLAHAAKLEGVASSTDEGGASERDWLQRLNLDGVEVVALTYFDSEPDALAHARLISRRLKRRAPTVTLLVVSGPSGAATRSSLTRPADQGPMEHVDVVVADIDAGLAWLRDRWPHALSATHPASQAPNGHDARAPNPVDAITRS
jgi:predicted PurR-regulated permease PerM